MKSILKKIPLIPAEPNRTKKSASLLELFFDLVFVAFIGSFVHRAMHMLEHEGKSFTWYSFFFIVMTLISVILTWRHFTIYSARYEQENNWRHRIFTLLIMIGMGIISASMFINFSKDHHNGHHLNNFGNFNTIVLVTTPGYILTIWPLAYLFLSSGLKAKNKYEKKKQILLFVGISGLSLVSFPGLIINIIYNSNFSRWLSFGFWVVAIIFCIVMSWVASSRKIAVNTVDQSLSHLKERVGIIFIVFIGESVIQIIQGSSETLIKETSSTLIKMTITFIVLFSWWWWFNDTINFPDIKNAPRKISLYNEMVTFLLVSLAFSAIGFAGIIKSPEEKYPKIMLAIGASIWCLSNTLTFTTLKNYNKKLGLIFPPILRKFIYIMPLILIPIFHIVIYDAISNIIFLYITLSLSFILIPFSIVVNYISNKKYHASKEKIINKYSSNEEKEIKDKFYKFIDIDIHKDYKFNLNHYSQYVKKS